RALDMEHVWIAARAAQRIGIAACVYEYRLHSVHHLADREAGRRRDLTDDHRDFVALDETLGLAEAVWGLTESSITSSILRPMTPPAALTSSAANFTPMTAYSPSGPRKPVNGVRCPMRMASACALTIAGMPIAASSAEPAVLFSNARRDTFVIMAIPSLEPFA